MTDILKKLGVELSPYINELIKVPKKIKFYSKQKTFQDNIVLQTDLLFLPDDNEFKYLLVVVDIYDRNVDFEPIKNKKPSTIVKAFKSIFKRKYINPKDTFMIYSDQGTEFKNTTVKNYLKSLKIGQKFSMINRHSQTACVEAYNKIIGKILNLAMLDEETKKGLVCRQWTKHIPKLRILLNKKYKRTPKKMLLKDINHNIFKKQKLDKIIKVGDKVRVKLMHPTDYTTGKRLHGNFRTGDIRFAPEVRIIKKVLIEPNSPIRYMVKGLQVAFYHNELQLVKHENNEKYVVEKIVGKKKINNLVYYNVKWLHYGKKFNTWEPRKELIKDVKQLIKDYDKKHK